MNSEARREEILKVFKQASNAIKGSELAKVFGVTRQVIVRDVAILRASGNNIIATPQGYILNSRIDKVKRIIGVNHPREDIEKELKIIVKYGGIVEDVTIEHPLYGEIKANLMLRNMNDVENFVNVIDKLKTNPLLELTEGVHLHTIYADNEEDMSNILNVLKKENLLIT